jgi:20S proteasome alpha/beta subunit
LGTRPLLFEHISYPQGYNGCAVGKGKQVAKTEIEKLDLANMTARQAIKEAAKMYRFFVATRSF